MNDSSPTNTYRDFEVMGSAAITAQGQVTLPKAARDASGLAAGSRVLVFAGREAGQILLTHEPLADELIELAAHAAKRKRST